MCVFTNWIYIKLQDDIYTMKFYIKTHEFEIYLQFLAVTYSERKFLINSIYKKWIIEYLRKDNCKKTFSEKLILINDSSFQYRKIVNFINVEI